MYCRGTDTRGTPKFLLQGVDNLFNVGGNNIYTVYLILE